MKTSARTAPSDQRVDHQSAGILDAAAAQGTGHGGGHAAAHAAQAMFIISIEGEDQREAGQRIGAQPAEEVDVDGHDQDLHHHEPVVGPASRSRLRPMGAVRRG